ncbi:MAG: hypothetical protein DME60_08165 [Verrucomicrobia bacterium]|nr:MAG: hypothetical protein DME60_08165 [Verrucomicrobiota bacterium]
MGDLEVRPWPALRGGQRLPELGWHAVASRRRVRSFLNLTKQKRTAGISSGALFGKTDSDVQSRPNSAYLLPWHTGLARITLDCIAEFNQVLHVFNALLKPAHFGCETLQSWFLHTGSVTHTLSYDPSQLLSHDPTSSKGSIGGSLFRHSFHSCLLVSAKLINHYEHVSMIVARVWRKLSN